VSYSIVVVKQSTLRIVECVIGICHAALVIPSFALLLSFLTLVFTQISSWVQLPLLCAEFAFSEALVYIAVRNDEVITARGVWYFGVLFDRLGYALVQSTGVVRADLLFILAFVSAQIFFKPESCLAFSTRIYVRLNLAVCYLIVESGAASLSWGV
jgi:hypothetical protein